MQYPSRESQQRETPATNFITYEDTVLDLFSKQVLKTPEHLAIKMGEKFLTYKEFDEYTDELAKSLRAQGVGRDSLVGILLPRSPEMIISIFAILKAGGAYMPIGHKDGKQRIQYILEDSECRVLLTQKKIINSLAPNFNQNIFNIDLNKKTWFYPLNENEQTRNDLSYPIRIDPTSLAYVIYTSGTTGKPKGALIEHRNLYSLITNYIPKLNSDDRTLQSMNIACDSSVVEIFPALCHGATLVLWDQDLSATIRNEKITHTCVTPSMIELLNLEDCKSLKKIIIAGEKLTPEVVKKIPSHTKIYNGYGPTECTVAISNTLIDDLNNIHIGGILNHCQVYVVKKNLSLCNMGEEGELLIGGIGVGRGYLNRPKLNSEKFILNPFGPGIVYKTGDLVRWRNNSELDFLGRIDRQVKVRGFRVELDGVEKKISSYPGVTQSFVKFDDKNLIAYLTPQKIQISKLKEYLGRKLAHYAIPTQFVTLDKFPLNTAGKIDDNKLPSPIFKTVKDPPSTKAEKDMAKIWQNLLFKDNYLISLSDNFFDLGGNSIDAMKLTRIMQEKRYPDFPMELIYTFPVLKDFVKAQGAPRNRNNYRIKDTITSWKKIFMDAIRSIPSTTYFYLAYSMPSLIVLAIFIYSPFLAICLIGGEFLFHRFFSFPDTMFFRKMKIWLQNGSWKYTSVKVIEDYPLETMPRTIFAIHPHGITEDHVFPFEKYLQDKNKSYKVLNHEVLFNIPLSKSFFSLLSGLPAVESSYKLAEKNDYNLLVTPGDVPEGLRSDELGAIALSSQKHFFKYVLATGTPLTPVYFHNNHKAFRLFNHFFQQRYNWFKKNRSLVFQPFWGRWYLPIPFKVDLLIAIGVPLLVEKKENPSWEEVEELYQRYLIHLGQLYKMHAPRGADLTFY